MQSASLLPEDRRVRGLHGKVVRLCSRPGRYAQDQGIRDAAPGLPAAPAATERDGLARPADGEEGAGCAAGPLKGDLFAWSGPQYLKKNGSDGKLPGAVDLNAGLEFKATKNLGVWAQFNNIFNKEYQRWSQYPVYGFNFVAGVVFSFDQKN